MAPARLDTRHVYLPLSSGRRFFRLSVHFFFLCSPASGRVRAWSSFIHVMSGRGCPLATHLRRTELPTGRAMTRRLILEGCVKRGRAAGRVAQRSAGPLGESRTPGHPRMPALHSPHCLLAGSSWPPEAPSCPGLSLAGPVSSAKGRACEGGAPAAPHPTPAGSQAPAGNALGTQAGPWAHTHVSESQRQLGRVPARPAPWLQVTPPGAMGPESWPPTPAPGGLQGLGEEGRAAPAAAVTLAHIKGPRAG